MVAGRCAARRVLALAALAVSDRAGSHGVAVHEKHAGVQAQGRGRPRRRLGQGRRVRAARGSAAFEATRAATVERVIAGREASRAAHRGVDGPLAVALAARRARPDRSARDGRRARRSGDAPGLPHAMELMFAAVDAQRHTWAAQREAYLASRRSARRRREFKATGDDYGAAARAPGPACSSASPTCSGTRRRPAPPRSGSDAEPHGAKEAGAAALGRGGGRGLRGAALRRAGRGVGGGRPAASRAALAARSGRRRVVASRRPRRGGSCDSAETAAARAAPAPRRTATSRSARRLPRGGPALRQTAAAPGQRLLGVEFTDYDRGGFVAATFDASVFALPGARLLEHWDLRHVGVFSRFPDPWDARRGDVGWLAEDVRLFAHNAQSPWTAG
ncbi:hypothetical protein JL722_15010 [Aureococcus anophagefferens]|nr:hypothetical protein JL722_15010 [Aureococcus anophagefferens]